MSYTRRDTTDGVTIMNKDLYDNLQDGIEQFGITPQMFGAKGDGVTDDTVAFKNTFQKLDNGGILFLPPGTYLISSSLDIPSGVTIEGSGQKTTVLKLIGNTIEDYFLKFSSIKNGGGIKNVSIDGNNYLSKLVTGIVLGSSVEDTHVNEGFIISNISVKRFSNNGIEYLSGWQATFQDIYISNCGNIGFLIKGSDTTFHDINISGCKCGLSLNAGTAKINNVKIDNCATTEEDYACVLKGERNNICNLEIQNCGPNGIFISGRQNSYYGVLLDQIGLLLNGTSYNEGSVVTFGSNSYCRYEIHIINTQEGVTLVSYDNAGSKGNDINYLWNLLKTNSIDCFTQEDCIFAKRIRNESFEVSMDLSKLIAEGVLTEPNSNAEGFPVYSSSFTLKVTDKIVPNLGLYKALLVCADFETTGNVSSSFYKGSEGVGKETVKLSNFPFTSYSLLKENVQDFNIYFSSTAQIKLRSLKVILFKSIYKTDWLFI